VAQTGIFLSEAVIRAVERRCGEEQDAPLIITLELAAHVFPDLGVEMVG
jgi:hypothetical protein